MNGRHAIDADSTLAASIIPRSRSAQGETRFSPEAKREELRSLRQCRSSTLICLAISALRESNE